QVRPGRAAGIAEAGDDLASLDGVADRDEVVRVVRVARHVAVAVVDLDELAVPVALAGPDDDAGGDREYVAAFAPGEVDALMKRAAPGEWIGTLTKARRDIARRHGTPAGAHLVGELTVEHQVLEDVELSGAVPELGLEAVERAQDAAQVE